MPELTEGDLARLARRRGWSVDPRRLPVILPEVRTLLNAAGRLRDLPIDPGAGMDDRDSGPVIAGPASSASIAGSITGWTNGPAAAGGARRSSADIAFSPAHEIASRVRRGDLSATEVTEAVLARIDRLQPALNCFTQVLAETALAQARALDAARSAGRPLGLLAGVPVGIKDIVDVAGTATTSGSHPRFHRRAASDAHLAARLRAAGAVIIGKTGLHEFAYGVTNTNPHFGPVRNPWDPTRIPGGSSGGSAAAVSAGLCAGAVGTDTGGSIRIPASLCGAVGLKPTYGLVSLQGVVPLSWSLDHAGPITRTVQDAALLLAAMAEGALEEAAGACASRHAAQLDLTGVRVGIPRSFFWERVDLEVARLVEGALEVLRRLGAILVDCEARYASYAGAVAAVVMSAEATAFHEDGLREHADAFGEDVRTRLERGLFLDGTDYVLGRRARRFLRGEFSRVFDEVDVLVTPTTQVAAAPIDEGPETSAGASLAMSVQLTRFTNPFNVTGLPALSLPCGFTGAGLPAGVQIVGPAGGEARVLRVGDAYERAADWGSRRPPLG